MIFITIENEDIVQVDDKTRIDVSKSFISGTTETITTYEIDPDNSGTFYDVSEDMHLDWKYAGNGETTIAVRITDSALNVENKTATILVKNALEDNLFSRDVDIVGYEPELMQWVQAGRDSFIDKHRLSQTYILNELDSKKIWKRDEERFTADDIVDIQEFKEWSKFMTLAFIFEGISNDNDDVFTTKARKYRSMAKDAAGRAVLRLDYNGDGKIDTNEKFDLNSGTLCRR